MGNDKIEVEGEIINNLRDDHFEVELDEHEVKVMAHISGKIRQNNIEIVPGDRVKVELSPHDLTRGRIVHRLT